jgi:hypothetical protein
LVLLENEKDLIPLNASDLKYIVLVGERTIGNQEVVQDFNNIGA